jgi:hypothetical protein
MTKILGLSFDDYVREQIDKRQNRLSQLQKTSDDLVVFNASTSWVKLASSVDLKDQVTINGVTTPTNRTTNSAKVIGVPSSDIADAKLAQKAVLFGGILYYDGINETPPLGGVLGGSTTSTIWNSAYGYLSKNDDVNYGLKPMPGITSVRITYKDNGTLKLAQVKLVAHSLPQFQAIELLYLRLGYTMLLEWGHTDFYNNSDPDDGSSHTRMRNTLADEFLNGIYNNDYMSLMNDIESYRKDASGNYDGMYAKVSNYSWTLNNNLGYDITLDLVSLGDIIDSLKFNSQSPYQDNNLKVEEKDILPGLANIDLNKGDSGFNAFLYEIRQILLTDNKIDNYKGTTEAEEEILELVKEQNQQSEGRDKINNNIDSLELYLNKMLADSGMINAISIFSTDEKNAWDAAITKIKNAIASKQQSDFEALGIWTYISVDDNLSNIFIIAILKDALESAYDSPNYTDSTAEDGVESAWDIWAVSEGYIFDPTNKQGLDL